MKILILLKTSNGALWALNLLKVLKDRFPDIRITVILPENGRYFEKYKEFCDEVVPFDFSIGLSIIFRIWKLRKLIVKIKPCLIHSFFTQTTLYARAACFKMNVPILFQVVGPLHLENKIFRIADICSANKLTDSWIATSEYIQEIYLKAGIPSNRVHLNYAYVDLPVISHESKSFNYLRERFNIPVDKKIIGTASYIYPPKFYEKIGVKGHEYLFEAFKELLKLRNDVVLVIAGGTFGNDLAYEEKLKAIALEIQGDIIFSGPYDNIASIISSFDVFVYLSRSENLGGVYESLYLKVPTVSSNCGALPELVRDNYSGFSCDPSDSSLVANRIDFLLNNPIEAQTLCENGFNLVVKTFEKESIIEKSYEIYKQYC
jgi:glycosyltransferase involved in cell wall biosynthesis